MANANQISGLYCAPHGGASSPSKMNIAVTNGTAGAKRLTLEAWQFNVNVRSGQLMVLELASDQVAALITELGGTPP
jgi:hypothetical protein